MLSFLSPCVLPFVLSYLSYISGISFDEFTDAADQPRLFRKVMINSLLFILGFSAVFMTFGVSFSLVGQILSAVRISCLHSPGSSRSANDGPFLTFAQLFLREGSQGRPGYAARSPMPACRGR